ncbi:MAG: hypothetical protein JNL84_02285 [Candidatus Accumulibacter sp.]|nr:hypothetical protein [Accumulibacter sp.]
MRRRRWCRPSRKCCRPIRSNAAHCDAEGRCCAAGVETRSQEADQTHPGKKLSDPGTTARFYKAVANAHLAHIIQVDLPADVFTYAIDERALNRARLMDGKLNLVNVAESSPAEIVERHKALVVRKT